MRRSTFRIGLRLGLLGGMAAAVGKLVQSRRREGPPTPAPAWPPTPPPPPRPHPVPPPGAAPPVRAPPSPAPSPARRPAAKKAPPKKAPPRKAPAKKAAKQVETAWVEPVGDVCPPSHPVKAKLSSKLFHLPGMFAYTRTRPDRC